MKKPTARNRLAWLIALLSVFALVAAACGDSAADNTAADDTAAEETASDESAETEESEEPEGDAEDEEAMEEESEPADEGEATGAGEDLKVVMILDGSAEDGGWNTAHVRGGQMVEEAFPDATVEYVEAIDPGQTATNAFEDAAAGGADVVIGTTYYQDDMMGVAADNPDTIFLTWAGFETSDNVGHYEIAAEDGRYLDGMIAGYLTQSNTIGYPAGFPFGSVVRAINAFTLGAQRVNPDVEVQVLFLNTWFDPALEQQAAEALANDGADVIAHEVGSQVYATVMAQEGGYVIGYSNDWSQIEPDAWASSFLFNWGAYYVEQVQAVVDGTWEPAITFGGIADGYIEFAPYGPDVTEEMLAEVDAVKAEMIDGTFNMFAGPISDNQGNVVIAEGEELGFDERPGCCDYFVEGVSGEIPG